MKPRPILAFSIATALVASSAFAQDAAPPIPPPTPGAFAPPAGPRPPDAAPPSPGGVPAGQPGAIPPSPQFLPPPMQPAPHPQAPVPPEHGGKPQRPFPHMQPPPLAEPARRPQEAMAPQPFLGVITSPLPPALAAQLGLPEGFGLLVGEVLPGSPAANAGIQRHDVLRLFNDQQLVEPNQLATLIRALGKDKDATLTLIRKGAEQTVTAKIAERPAPMRRPLGDVLRPVKPGEPFRSAALWRDDAALGAKRA